jgi:acyl-lipid omega-6 desaturase (Delta-12 desaturase)
VNGVDISQALLNDRDRAVLGSTGKAETWQHLVAPFRTADAARSVFQYVSNFLAAGLSEAAALYCLGHLPWLTPLFVLVTAGFMIRIFITFHDCGHGSYFSSQRWNDRAGILVGFCMMTPYYAWRKAHAIHHATSGDLDRRGTGEIHTCTVEEYLAMPADQQRQYRLWRHPLMVFFGGGIILFMLVQRFTHTWGFRKEDALRPKEIRNIHWTSLANACVLVLIGVIGGWQLLFLVHLPAFLIASGTGTMLFYLQHQFEDAYWRRGDEWSYLESSLRGSTWMRLPKVLQFFTGNIGIHHLHHLAPKIPNYKLQRCVDSAPMFREGVPIVGLREAYRALWLGAYDERSRKLISWRELDQVVAARAASAHAPVGPTDPFPQS